MRDKILAHKQFLASILAEKRVALLERSDWHALRHLALHWGLILAVGL